MRKENRPHAGDPHLNIILKEFRIEYPGKKEVYRVPIYWAQIRVSKRKVLGGPTLVFGTKRGHRIFFGFCMLHQKLFTVNLVGPILVLFTSDLYISEGRCEEGDRCLNLECPFNYTTKTSFLTSNGVPSKQWAKIKWENWTSLGSLTWQQAEQIAEVVLIGGPRKET